MIKVVQNKNRRVKDLGQQDGVKKTQDDLDGEREEVDLLQGLDLSVLDEPTEFGDRDPFLLIRATSTSAASGSAATSTTLAR